MGYVAIGTRILPKAAMCGDRMIRSVKIAMVDTTSVKV